MPKTGKLTARQGTAMSAIIAFPKAFPAVFNLGVATVKTSCADLITQCAVERKQFGEIDWKRNGSFAVFGFAYLGGFQYWLQINMFKRMFPTMERFSKLTFREKLKDTEGLKDVAKQIVFDVGIHLPFMYYPTFYTVKQMVQGDSVNPAIAIPRGIEQYSNNFVADNKAMLMVWAPADVIIFTVPLWLRLPVRHIVSLGWTCYLSFVRGGQGSKTQKVLT
jgi:hypothetical protein